MEVNVLLEAALAYARRGWPTFPCRPDKAPLVKGGCNAATTNEQTIRFWWAQHPQANIGIATGAVSGLAVVDIDPAHGGDEALAMLLEKHGPLPDTVESLTGGGGRHLLFRYRKGFRNSASRLGPGIDTRGDGGYIVAPPSLHASGKHYCWEGSSDPESTALAELPSWLFPGNLSFDATTAPDRPLADESPASEGSRNVRAAEMVGCYYAEGLSVSEARQRLTAWNATNTPPLPESEIEHVLKSVRQTHDRNHPASPVPEMAPEPPPPAPVAETPRLYLPPDLHLPPGLVGDIARWMNETAFKPQPILSLAAALALCGALMGRKIATVANLRTNLYCLGVAHSGAGKEHARSCVKRLCMAAGLDDKILAGEDVSSDTAILRSVKGKPAVLFQIDEIGHLVGNATRANAPHYLRAILTTFTKLYTSANTRFIGREYANDKLQPREDIEQPNACIYGTTVPAKLFSGLTPDEIRDGFLGRMLVFIADDDDPVECDCVPGPVPEALVKAAEAWYQRDDMPRAEGNFASSQIPKQIIVPATPEADVVFLALRAKCRAEKKRFRDDERGLDSLWARVEENARKVALIIAGGVNFAQPVITVETAVYASRLVECLTRSLVSHVGDNVAESRHAADSLLILRAIRGAGVEGISNKRLIKKAQKLDASRRKAVLDDLLQSGQIGRREKVNERGPVTPIYYLAKATHED